MAEDVMMSAISVLGPDFWWVSDIKWAAYKATAATIFFARVDLTHKQRRDRSTVAWRRNTLHYHAGMEASTLRASHMMAPAAVYRLRKINLSEVLMLLVVESLVTVCEYSMNKAKDPRVYANWGAAMKNAMDATKQGGPPLGLRSVLKDFRLHNDSDEPLHWSLAKDEQLEELLHIDMCESIQNRRSKLLEQPDHEDCHDSVWEEQHAAFKDEEEKEPEDSDIAKAYAKALAQAAKDSPPCVD